jgi:hypothetical protein
VTCILAGIRAVICFLLLWLTKVTYLKLFLSDPFPGTYRKHCSIIGCYLQTYPAIDIITVPLWVTRSSISSSTAHSFLQIRGNVNSKQKGTTPRTQSRDLSHKICTAVSDSISAVRSGCLQYRLSNLTGGDTPSFLPHIPFVAQFPSLGCCPVS